MKNTIIYIHGIGPQHDKKQLKLDWDLALFGVGVDTRTRMAHWADILHGDKPSLRSARLHAGPEFPSTATLMKQLGIADGDARAANFLDSFSEAFAPPAAQGPSAKALLLPGFLRKPISRLFLQAFVKDTAAYFFNPEIRKRIQQRLIDELKAVDGPIILVAHSQGTIISYEVLSTLLPEKEIVQYVTIGSPLGLQEVQDYLLPGADGQPPSPLRIPGNVKRWNNFADPLDPVALDKGLRTDFVPEGFINDEIILNESLRHLTGFNPHLAVGYLAHPRVRQLVQRSIQYDVHARFVLARDVAELMAAETRHSVLIEALLPGSCALGETQEEMERHEKKPGEEFVTLADRIAHLEKELHGIVGKRNVAAAKIDPLRHFISASLTPAELAMVADAHKDLRIYSVWKSVQRRKLLDRSQRVIQTDAARNSYRAAGSGITWAVLDTGVSSKHPHFDGGTIQAVWDCTKPGRPRRLQEDTDKDGHGTHVCGIIAGSSSDKHTSIEGVAPEAKLVVYKVLDDDGAGEDAWIIKALDHIAEQNENANDIAIHGINLSLGGPFDASVYGCGFSPICAELRRLWRSGVLVVVACGNEGQVVVSTPNGEQELNSSMSIGDPANLEDCISVGSVNSDKPHLYGISSFSSRGPTADGRGKPDVVGPGERITSCNARHAKGKALYRVESGTSMAAPHISGLLAAFLSARREYRGRPDEVKDLLLRTSTDLGRDRYHQGRGVPNLMKMLLEA